MKGLRAPGIRTIRKQMAVVLLLMVTVGPIIFLAIGLGEAVAEQQAALSLTFNGDLFLRSLGITLAATALSVLLGFLVAIGIFAAFPLNSHRIVVVVLSLILIPAFVHVQSWIFFVDAIVNLFNGVLGTAANFNGLFAGIITMAITGLPITAGLILIAILAIPAEIADLVLLDGPGPKAFVTIYLPYLLPGMGVGAFVFFLLNINDYGIASVFGVSTYALELFSQFSAGMNVYQVFYNGLPLMVMALAVLLGFGFYVAKMDFSLAKAGSVNPFQGCRFITVLGVSGLLIAGIFVLVPVGNLLYETARCPDIGGVLAGSAGEIGYGLLVSALVAVIAFIPGLLLAWLFHGSRAGYWLLILAALPFIIPGPVLGLAMIRIWNTPLLGVVYGSPLMPVVALVARFTFIEALILAVAISALNQSLLDNMAVHWPGSLQYLKCIYHLLGRKALGAMLIVFALSLGEFGVSLLVMPPGFQTITIKIYNYLHYGASDVVAVLCLFMLLMVILVIIGLFLMSGGEKNE